MKKRKFTPFERYSIWKCHEERCWLCTEPLSYKDTTVDHFFPEELLYENQKRLEILREYGLSDRSFNINDFENWLPSHASCNERKSTKVPKFVPGNAIVLEKLISKSSKVRQTFNKMTRDKKTDKVFLALLNALETEEVSFEELLEFIKPLTGKENIQFLPNDLILLSGGYWIFKNEIAHEGLCTCERNYCVENDKKVYCYFSRKLSPWVIRTGLYHKCYDEFVICPRCGEKHKRGHIGKNGICARPYINQELQRDLINGNLNTDIISNQ